VSDPLLNIIQAKATVQPFSTQSDTNNFVSLLNQGNNFYAVSVGYPASTGAQIDTLSPNLATSLTQTPIADSNSGLVVMI